MLRYRTRKEAAALGVRGLGQNPGDAASHPGRVDSVLPIRRPRRRAEAEPGATDTAARAVPRRQVRGRLPDQRGGAALGGPVGDPGRPFELDLSPAPVQPLDVGLVVGQPVGTSARRTLLAGVALPMPPSVNAYWRSRVITVKATGRQMAVVYVTHEGKAYQDL